MYQTTTNQNVTNQNQNNQNNEALRIVFKVLHILVKIQLIAAIVVISILGFAYLAQLLNLTDFTLGQVRIIFPALTLPFVLTGKTFEFLGISIAVLSIVCCFTKRIARGEALCAHAERAE
ncbi:MAG: hypothetical protein LBQ95_08610 [Lachnospiraceae bacterium]|jgi:type III secretory pathway component EscU|nr:hypothetical protein [Lachnospiraceae bacterium]